MEIDLDTAVLMSAKWSTYCETPTDEHAQAVVDALGAAGHTLLPPLQIWTADVAPRPPAGTILYDRQGSRWVMQEHLRVVELDFEGRSLPWSVFLQDYGPATEERRPSW